MLINILKGIGFLLLFLCVTFILISLVELSNERVAKEEASKLKSTYNAFIVEYLKKPYCVEDTASVLGKIVKLKRCFKVVEIKK